MRTRIPLILCFALALGPLHAQTPQADDRRETLLRLLNQERARDGAPPLLLSPELGRVAQQRAEEVSRQGSLRYLSQSGEMQERLRQAGYQAQEWAENRTSTTADAGTLIRRWRERDPTAFRRLMDPAYRDLGIGLSRLGDSPLYVFLYAVPRGEVFARETAGLRDLAKVRAGMLERVNAIRKRERLKPLSQDHALDQAAQGHAEDMLARSYFEHRSPEGTTVRERSKAARYYWAVIGENIAEGQTSLDEVMETWMNSPGHRKNILSPNFTELGVGLALGRGGDGKYRAVWVQNFGRPRQPR